MFILFFTIVFIAEITLAVIIVKKLIELDNKVLELNKKVVKFKPVLCEKLTFIKKVVSILTSVAKYIDTYVNDAKKNFTLNAQKNIIILLLFFILKIPFKRVSTAINLLFIPIKLYSAITGSKSKIA